eukprot:TRINITY_DN3574_c0_g1_i2.p1 TRINITY_DN3574_c0_g1~~TRINITY_DN3574_c0_g1_i2.p1  ORF type:complete len:282 (+),score=59.22 TRINITY_DN3574_c0_g1_i2:225-1070(+)
MTARLCRHLGVFAVLANAGRSPLPGFKIDADEIPPPPRLFEADTAAEIAGGPGGSGDVVPPPPPLPPQWRDQAPALMQHSADLDVPLPPPAEVDPPLSAAHNDTRPMPAALPALPASSLLSIHTASVLEWPKREAGPDGEVDHGWNAMVEIAMQVSGELNKRVSGSAKAAEEAATVYRRKREALLQGLDDFAHGARRLKVQIPNDQMEHVRRIQQSVRDGQKHSLAPLGGGHGVRHEAAGISARRQEGSSLPEGDEEASMLERGQQQSSRKQHRRLADLDP